MRYTTPYLYIDSVYKLPSRGASYAERVIS
jgi:hypothetical protein